MIIILYSRQILPTVIIITYFYYHYKFAKSNVIKSKHKNDVLYKSELLDNIYFYRF